MAELLIALAILGVIASFTIPKVLSAQQKESNNAIALEAVATISAAYQSYKLKNTITSGFSIKNLTPYLNYVRVDTTSSIDGTYTGGTRTCGDSSDVCLKLHNGAYLEYWTIDYFGGTATTNAVPFNIDPDGKITDGTTNGPGKAITFWLYTDGRIVDTGNVLPGTQYKAGAAVTAKPEYVPPWFHWN